MIEFRQKQVQHLRDKASAIEAADELVTVALSLPAAWLLRDLIGLGTIRSRVYVPAAGDLDRLNSALGTCPVPDDPNGHVSQWSRRQINDLLDR